MKSKYFAPFFIIITFMMIGLFSVSAYADGPVVDPTITPTATISCNYPVEREDGTTLNINEIALVNFYVANDLTPPIDWQPAGSNNAECKQVYNLADIPDNQYYYTVTAVDTDGRESVKAYDANPLEVAKWLVKRIADPRNPTGITQLFN